MKHSVIMIKLNSSSSPLKKALANAEQSYTEGVERFYYTNITDTETIEEFCNSVTPEDWSSFRIVFIEYEKCPDIHVKKLYIGNTVRLEQENTSYQIFYRINSIITYPLVIDNFMRFSNLNIDRDFEEGSYISIEESAPLLRQISYAAEEPRNTALRSITYEPLERENTLSPLAQKNEYCRRLYNAQPVSKNRGEFQRDYDRIVHSKAFRRMSDKAQIFTASKGDHYRTRMTHTLCVTQIARSIALKLNMNIPLTEAIALGHDLGHTPFGHQGERTLNNKATGFGITGFKHNYQSLKVATMLEEEYIEHSGLDLSAQTLEGMWKHTKIRKKPDSPLICSITDFLPSDVSEDFISKLYADESYCSTIEGQIVFIADEIAQRSHDLEDALSAGLLSFDGLLDMLSLKKLNELKKRSKIYRQPSILQRGTAVFLFRQMRCFTAVFPQM